MDRRSRGYLTAATLLLAAGWALWSFSASTQTCSVEGDVLIDSRPLEDGVITFTHTKMGKTAAANVIEGHFRIPRNAGLVPGEYRVRVLGYRVTTPKVAVFAVQPMPDESSVSAPGSLDTGTTEPIKEQYLPARYNSQSTLSIDLNSGNNQAVDFDLFEQEAVRADSEVVGISESRN